MGGSPTRFRSRRVSEGSDVPVFSVGVVAPWGCTSGRGSEYSETWSGATGVHARCGSVSILVESRRRDFRRLSRQGFSQSVTFRRGPPAAALTTKSLHHRLKGRLHSPRSTQVLSTRKSHRQGVRVVAKGSSLVSPVWEWNWKLESLSTLSRLVSRSRERTDFLVHIRSTCVAVVSCTQLMYDHALKPRLTNLVSLSYLAARSHGRLLAQRCLLIPSIHGQRSSPLAAACQLLALGRRSSAPRAGAAQQ